MIAEVLDGLDRVELDRERATPWGQTTGREVLLWAVMHASGHLAAAQLTRDMVLARREDPTSPTPAAH